MLLQVKKLYTHTHTRTHSMCVFVFTEILHKFIYYLINIHYPLLHYAFLTMYLQRARTKIGVPLIL